jgi:hypothetical protein
VKIHLDGCGVTQLLRQGDTSLQAAFADEAADEAGSFEKINRQANELP